MRSKFDGAYVWDEGGLFLGDGVEIVNRIHHKGFSGDCRDRGSFVLEVKWRK